MKSYKVIFLAFLVSFSNAAEENNRKRTAEMKDRTGRFIASEDERYSRAGDTDFRRPFSSTGTPRFGEYPEDRYRGFDLSSTGTTRLGEYPEDRYMGFDLSSTGTTRLGEYPEDRYRSFDSRGFIESDGRARSFDYRFEDSSPADDDRYFRSGDDFRRSYATETDRYEGYPERRFREFDSRCYYDSDDTFRIRLLTGERFGFNDRSSESADGTFKSNADARTRDQTFDDRRTAETDGTFRANTDERNGGSYGFGDRRPDTDETFSSNADRTDKSFDTDKKATEGTDGTIKPKTNEKTGGRFGFDDKLAAGNDGVSRANTNKNLTVANRPPSTTNWNATETTSTSNTTNKAKPAALPPRRATTERSTRTKT